MNDLFLIPVEVDCRSEYKAEESPRIIHTLEGPVTIETVLDRWYQGGPDPTERIADYYKVQGEDGVTYLLKHDCEKGEWFLCERVKSS